MPALDVARCPYQGWLFRQALRSWWWAHVVGFEIIHGATHARKTFAEAKVVSWVGLGRFALRPIPIAAVLNVHDVDGVVADDVAPTLQPQVVHTTQTFLKHLWRHNRRADGQHHAAVQSFHRRAEQAEIRIRRAPNRRPAKHRVTRDDVVADAWMHGQRNLVTESVGENGCFLPRMLYVDMPAQQLVFHHGAQQFSAGWSQRVGWLVNDEFFQRLSGRELHAVFIDETSKTLTITQPIRRPR
jgi:hypothetical protein